MIRGGVDRPALTMRIKGLTEIRPGPVRLEESVAAAMRVRFFQLGAGFRLPGLEREMNLHTFGGSSHLWIVVARVGDNFVDN
jgi:hypothetical protein